ncbi:MAG: TerC family protein [Gammaproteobacteria bacterium]|nr:TerC family protein [Gammaproteobacteria bacterium]MBU1625492.1 TerC family protein [Gammaproteobacteria bacterium]MBU1980752.1 TerC family protein [Gammaproteobacteria bacterium]
MLEMMQAPQFWADVFKIILIDLLLSGDNAVVIALACRNLPEAQRRKGILYGVGGAIGLRVVLTFFAVSLLALPYLKLVGALLLLWIGIKLLLPEEEAHGEGAIKAEAHLWGAVKTIIVADFVMSLDNVLGVAAVAKDNVWLLVFGLLVSIPMIAWSSQLVLKLIDRYPVIIYAGGALLGYVAGEMLLGEALFKPLVEAQHVLHWMVPVVCALLVLGIGKWLAARKVAVAAVRDLADGVVAARKNSQEGEA